LVACFVGGVRHGAAQGGVLRVIFSCFLRCGFCVCVSSVLVVLCVCRRLCWLVLYVRWFATGACEGAGLLAALCTYVRKGFSLPARRGFVFCGTGCCRASASHPTRGVGFGSPEPKSRKVCHAP
jgi:hypothetical protein